MSVDYQAANLFAVESYTDERGCTEAAFKSSYYANERCEGDVRPDAGRRKKINEVACM